MIVMKDRTSVTVRLEQHAELTRVARTLAASEDHRVTLADVIDRLLDLWCKTTSGKAATVTFDASGNGTARIGPIHARESWQPAVVSVKASTSVAEADCQIFCGPDTSDSNFVDATQSGSSGDSTGNVAGRTVKCGEYVFAVWTGGDAGAQGRMNVQGTKVAGDDEPAALD